MSGVNVSNNGLSSEKVQDPSSSTEEPARDLYESGTKGPGKANTRSSAKGFTVKDKINFLQSRKRNIVKRKTSKKMFIKGTNKRRQHNLKNEKLRQELRKSELKNIKVQFHRFVEKSTAELQNNKNKFYHSLLKLNSKQQLFIQTIMKNTDKSPQGRRFTEKEKLLCLAIEKKSGKTYEFLSKMLHLPSRRTIRKISSEIKIDCGMSSNIRKYLKTVCNNMNNDLDKHCTLVWDEVALSPHVDYSSTFDKVIGFEDWGSTRTCRYADHALVFMLTGIVRPWKLLVSYNFCKGQTNATQLYSSIKEVTGAVLDAGFTLQAYVCDRGSSNVKVMDRMLAESKERKNDLTGPVILFKKKEIIQLYDVPHLLKSIRNNFLKYDILTNYKMGMKRNERKIASWEHIIMAHDISKTRRYAISKLLRISEYHVDPKRIPKMKVKIMMQVFSKTLANQIACLADWPHLTSDLKVFPRKARVTSKLLSFLNNLADLLNGKYGERPIYRQPWKVNSIHSRKLKTCVKHLEKMRFITKKGGIKKHKCFTSLISAVNGFDLLWTRLQEEGVVTLCTRFVNQDCLENAFSCIKSFGGRNNKPTCLQFVDFYKTLMVNSFTAKYSPINNTNCQMDYLEFLSAERSIFSSLDSNCGEVVINQAELDKISEFSRFELIYEEEEIIQTAFDAIRNELKRLAQIKECRTCIEKLNNIDISREIIKALFRELTLNFCRYDISKVALPDVTCLCDEHSHRLLLKYRYVTCQKVTYLYCLYVNRMMCGKITGPLVYSSYFFKEAYELYQKTLLKRQRSTAPLPINFLIVE